MEPVICLLKADLSSVSIVGWHKLPAHVETGIPVEAHIAQSVEHFLGKEEVIGSNPIVSTIRCSGGFIGMACMRIEYGLSSLKGRS